MTDQPEPVTPTDRLVIASIEAAHEVRHVEIGHPCEWDPDDSLDTGCSIRYRLYREWLGLPSDYSFDDSDREFSAADIQGPSAGVREHAARALYALRPLTHPHIGGWEFLSEKAKAPYFEAIDTLVSSGSVCLAEPYPLPSTARTETEWNVIDPDGDPYLQPWCSDEGEARGYARSTGYRLVARERTRTPDHLSPTRFV